MKISHYYEYECKWTEHLNNQRNLLFEQSQLSYVHYRNVDMWSVVIECVRQTDELTTWPLEQISIIGSCSGEQTLGHNQPIWSTRGNGHHHFQRLATTARICICDESG